MHRLLERLDGMASTIVPLAYLAALFLGTAAYFGGAVLNYGAAVGLALACASELHSFLASRRARAAYGALARVSKDDAQYETLRGAVRANVAILAALLAFQEFTSIGYTVETFTPAQGFLPGWLQIGIRGSAVPFLFLLAGFLVPLAVDAGPVLSRASGDMLHKTIKATVKQWNTRIDRARRSGLDLAPVAVSLMLDAGDSDGARRIQLIADGLAHAEGRTLHAELAEPSAPASRALTLASFTPDTPPTDGGTPLGSSKTTEQEVSQPDAALFIVPESGAMTIEARVRRYLRKYPDASIKRLARALKISESTASKYRRVVMAENERTAAPVAR